MAQRKITLTDGFIHVPITNEAPKKILSISDGEGNRLAQFHVELSLDEKFDYYALKVPHMEGKDVILSCEGETAEAELNRILVGGTIDERTELYPNIYKEPERQQIHFSSRRGWINDPNGLVYADGKYRMCYQHNPLGNHHGGVNISWGLTESEDGIHFKEYPDAIIPKDCLTHIASGSAIIDTDNISCKGKGTIIATYTALQSRELEGYKSVGNRGQMLVYSTDGGYTFHDFPTNPIITVAEGQYWRDPKILRMDDGSLCIAVFETYEDETCVSFYSSKDCVNWKFESRTMDLYECPDLFPLPVQETGEIKWILYGANGMYRVGEFKDYKYTQIGESYHLDYGMHTYAGQTWNNHPDTEGRYHIAWIAERGYGPEETPFSQSMSLLCRFSLHQTEDGYRLFRNPIEAVDTLRGDVVEVFDKEHPFTKNCEACALPIPGEAEFLYTGGQSFSATVNGQGFIYNKDSKHLVFTSGKEYTLTTDTSKGVKVRIIVDTRSVEYFINDEISATYFSYGKGETEKKLYICGRDVNEEVHGCIRTMNSIWE